MEERIALMRDDPAFDLTVDGNGIAGMLEAVFGAELTAREERCTHCGTVSSIGTLRVYMRGPGIVARCPACTDIVLRLVQTPTGVRVDLRGADGLTLRIPT
jgi:uncharacterized protein DUF6510